MGNVLPPVAYTFKPASYSPSAKAGKNISNTLTAEDILAKMRALGATNVGVQSTDYSTAGAIPDEYWFDENGQFKTNFIVTIAPSLMERLIKDPVFLEQQLSILRGWASVFHDPRVLAATENAGTGGLVMLRSIDNFSIGLTAQEIEEQVRHLVSVIMGKENGACLLYDTEKGEDYRYLTQEEIRTNENMQLTELHKHRLASRFALYHESISNQSLQNSHGSVSCRITRAMENFPSRTVEIGNEGHRINRATAQSLTLEYGDSRWSAFVTADGIWIAAEGWHSLRDFSLLDVSKGVNGIPESTIQDMVYMGKILANMTPPQLVQSGNVWHSSGISVAQREPYGYGFATDGAPTDEHLRSALWNIANAFSTTNESLGDMSSMWRLESAFKHLLNSDHNFVTHLLMLNMGDTTEPDSDRFAQMREQAEAQIEAFGRNFLAKYVQYGLEDGFNVAWGALRKS